MPETPIVYREPSKLRRRSFLAAAANYVATLPGFMLAGIASTAPQTLALVESSAPDVLLLDLGMGLGRLLGVLRAPPATSRQQPDARSHDPDRA